MPDGFKVTTDLYREVFRAAPDGIAIISGDGRIRAVNPKVSEIFGYEPAELEGELVEVLVPDGQRGNHAAHRDAYRDNPRSRAMGLGLELRGRRKDGTEFPIEVALSPFDAGEEGCSQCVIAILRDVTERARTRSQAFARMQASEAERRRIAQDLHDDTAQRLAALLIHLRLVGRSPSGMDAHALQNLRDQVEAISDGVRRVARGLRPPELDDVGLGPALRTWVRTVSEEQEFAISVETDPVETRLTSEAKLMLYRIVQEAITNAVRHSGASDARVELRIVGDEVRATVADDGCGFDAAEVLREGTRLGLSGMHERASMIGAKIVIESIIETGTTVIVTLPCVKVETSLRAGS